MKDYLNPGAPTPATTTINVHIYANSLAELRDQLQKALDDMGWAPQAPTPVQEPQPLPEDAVTAAPVPVIVEEKPKRQRKAKEEAPAAPAQDPTSSSPAPTAATAAAGGPAAEAGAPSAATSAEAPSPSTSAATSSPPSSAAPTHEQAKQAAEEWLAQHPDGREVGKKEIRAMLATYGVQRIAELPPGQIQSFLDDLSGGDV